LKLGVTLGGQGAGVFALERYNTSGTYTPIGTRLDGGGAGGHAIFEIPAAQLTGLQSLSLRLRIVAGNPAATPMPVFLQASQPHGPLTPEDALGNELPTLANGRELSPVLAQNQPGVFDFQVDFS